ncbi:YiiX/YebB-like N1pC/P60 family cysteine hydrolase [Cyclobacterium qasimii]|uniref:Permuted papain-like amidase YaeF/Yiix C92 family enzyme n=2 Tax=Cyclobacterium qasimii TaxID=1350429 RepID=S7VE59_9BACT|nr:YiiX/YebB-like N1pC/P60 family cysteine hydrolase [Cyclobacterium qasimii]EPR68520.1 hypothetical protein ADICYQ_2486 [Cyclobacterium qasimii M12-11B]GEO23696.1 UDP-N-acetylmuramoylalanyl-D-glutamate--2, 6-diaminopimelate ligase [Cyclobacterium qasimii]
MKKLTTVLLLVFGLLTLSCNSKEPWDNWKTGDILFQNGDCGDFCDAIKKVTAGYQGQSFSHNGMLINENGNWMVLEAVSQGVKMTPLEDFLNRYTTGEGYPKVNVGRLKEANQHLIPEAILFGKTLIGKPYDNDFDLENDAYYCSELIHFSLMKANKGLPVFDTPPMTFKDPATNETFPVWKKYFAKLNLEIPEGEPGLNPGGMSLSPALDMIHNFEKP